MRFPRSIQIALVVLVLGAAGLLLWRSIAGMSPANPDAPEGTIWLCRAAGCGRDFTLSTKDLGAFYDQHPDGSPPCPACGKADTARAVRCEACHKAFEPPARSSAAGKGQARKCPHCGKAMG